MLGKKGICATGVLRFLYAQMIRSLLLCVLGLFLALTPASAQTVMISEFMASNQNGILDEDGTASDWIEIYNSGATPVNLAGWRLTDDSANLSKWVLPAVTVDPKGFLLVFASAKNRAVAGAPLHTNFKLGSSGGYLGLVKADGSVSHAYNPYPAQYDDKPYGLQHTVSTSTLIAPAASLKWLVPTAPAPTDATWAARTFNDSGWTAGINGVGFESTVPGFAFRTYFANVGIGSIATANSVIATPSLQTQTYAETRSVVNYLDSGGDGHYAPQSNPSWATGGADNYVVEATGIVTIPTSGTWTFGVNSDDGFQLQVRAVGAGTWITVCSFDGGRGVADTLGTYSFAAAGDYEIRVMIYEGNGGSAGEAFAKQGSTATWDAGFRLIGDTAAGGLAVKSIPLGSGGSGYTGQVGAGSNTKAAMSDASPQKAACYVRIPFTNPGGLTSLTMPVRYDDGFVAYLNGTEVARRNAPAGVPTNLTAATLNRLPILALTPENVDLTPFLGSLVAGSGNVLAIHGLNDSAASGDFLQKAELAQYSVTLGSVPNFYTTATPGGFNTAAIYNKVAPVVAGVERGIYTASQMLALSTGTPGAVIRYTFDGSVPTETSATSATYGAAISIASTTTLRYRAFKAGFDPSDTLTQTYLFLSDVITQSPTGAAPVISNPSGATQAQTVWPTGPINGQILDYGMDPDVVNAPAYSGTIVNDLKTIPTISIVTDLPNLFDASTGIYSNPSGDTITWERPASLELIYPNGATQGFQINCGLRVRGGFSRSTSNPKHAFRILFRDTYGASKLKFPICGTAPGTAQEFDRFDLRCAQNYSWSFGGDGGNGIFIRDVIARDMQLAMGSASSHAVFYHLYVNGQYWGLYNTDERPDSNFGASYWGGSKDDYDAIKIDPDIGYNLEATDGSTDAWFSLWQLADGMTAGAGEAANNTTYQRLLGLNPDGMVNPAYPALFDPVNTIDAMLVVYYGGNLDAQISNFLSNNSPNNAFWLRDRTGVHGGFRSVLHDSEHTLLNVNENRLGPWPAGSTAAGSTFGKSTPQYVFQQCMYSDQFRMLVADRFFKHTSYGGVLTPATALALFNTRTTEIDRAVVAESARWGDSKVATPLTRDTNWVPATNNVRSNFFPNRTTVMRNQMRAIGWYPSIDPPLWSLRGGTVAPGTDVTLSLVSGQSGTVYYTTDGTDPRQYNAATGLGDVAPTAQVYSGPITIAVSRFIRTRVKNGSTWSAIDEAAFYTTQDYAGLAITEIHYNPLPNGAIVGEEYEFLELKNTTANPMDLGGLSFTVGIAYSFPPGTILAPGAFYVIVRNSAEFSSRYPAVTVNGVYTGRLDNAGEALSVTGPSGGTVLSLTYSDRAPWPAAPDGNGFSAVPAGATYNSNDGRNWRASAAVGGSPGADDPAVNFPAIVVNEALSNSTGGLTDTIELYNPTGSPVNVGDWWLSDDRNVPQKYRIPGGTTIGACQYVSFNEAQFNPTPGVGTSFALNSVGEDVYVFSGNAGGAITGYAHGFSFAGAEQNVSFGRYVNSVGDEHFPRQISRTFGAANSGPLVGPLVINEVMYNPYAGYDEYVEIRNISASAVNLFDPANPANTWKLSGLGFTFPTGQSIPAGGLALLVPIDPAVFRAKYGVPAPVQIFGPYAGVLQNSGERLSLEMPDTPVVQNSVLVVPYDVIDSVRYNDKLPWPVAAAGGGPALQRTNSAAYADDPANWFASGATPGFANSVNQPPTVALTAPANGATYVLPATVSFAAAASDTDGSIVKVEFYVDGGKVGEDASAPYTFDWSATGGVHSCTAVAIDSSLGVTVSAPLNVYVTTPVSQGLKAQYFVGAENFTTGPAGVRIDPTIDFSKNGNWPLNTGFPSITNDNYSVRWSGQVRPTTSGTYTFYINSDDGSFLYLNGALVISNGGYHGDIELSYAVSLTAGQLYTIQMDMFQGGGGATARLSWSKSGTGAFSKQVIPQSALYPASAPIIITQPVGITREQGTSATFTVFASGLGNTYQWLKNGGQIIGATGTTLTLPYVLPADAGQYACLVSNADGFAASNTVTLSVTFTDTDGDGMQDSWETANGFNPNSAADATLDTDGDGMINREEFLAGTDPRNAASKLTSTVTKNGTGQSVIRFTAQPYKSYTVQYKNALSDTAWTRLTDVAHAATLRTMDVTDTTGNAGTKRFYRVITPQAP